MLRLSSARDRNSLALVRQLQLIVNGCFDGDKFEKHKSQIVRFNLEKGLVKELGDIES